MRNFEIDCMVLGPMYAYMKNTRVHIYLLDLLIQFCIMLQISYNYVL